MQKIKSNHKQKKLSYDLFVSLGYGCPASRILRNCNLQFVSFPFDWIYGSDILGKANIIANKFEDFLNIDFLEFYSQVTGKDCYKNTKLNIGFPHDFRLNTPLNISYKEVNEKYNRRIKRLYDLINKSNKVCFVYITTGDDNSSYDNKNIEKAQKIIADCFPNKQIDILFFENSTNNNIDNFIKINANIKKYIFDHSNPDKNLYWEVDDKKIAQVLKKYSITKKNLTFLNLLQKYKIFSITRYQNHKIYKLFSIKISRRIKENV